MFVKFVGEFGTEYHDAKAVPHKQRADLAAFREFVRFGVLPL